MKAHRHHSPRTAIILILISVLSFAFIACDASKKCVEYGSDDFHDKEVCEKGCNDENAEFRHKACEIACNLGENLSACSKSCKLYASSSSSSSSYYAINGLDCKFVCDHGDTAACELYKKYLEEGDKLSAEVKEWKKQEAALKKQEAALEIEVCHVTKWQLIGDVPNQSISLSYPQYYGQPPISIPEDAAIECATTTGSIERFQTAVELGERPNPASLNRFSKELLKCGKAIGSNELVERAKKCNGKWY